MRGLPLLWRLFVEPVYCKWCCGYHSEFMIPYFWDSPTWRRSITIFRGSNLGMTAYQLSNKGQDLNLVFLYALV
jgi:hypothetical protein